MTRDSEEELLKLEDIVIKVTGKLLKNLSQFPILLSNQDDSYEIIYLTASAPSQSANPLSI
jgi:hypothetical protein